MKLQIWAALLPMSVAFSSAQSSRAGKASYIPMTTITASGSRPSDTLPVPAAPTQTKPALPPSTNSYKLNSSFVISSTPVTRTFNWTIGRQYGNPDGYNRSLITINGLMPGPLVEANEGDRLVLNILNGLVNETTSIHWHGMHQNGTAFMDGVPGITQPGKTFTYNFTLTQYGTYWYHSHSGAQFTDGLSGAMIIHSVNDPLVRGVDFDHEEVLFIQDWYHDEANTIVNALLSEDGYEGSIAAPSPQSGIINGQGVYNCSALSSNNTVNCRTLTPPEFVVQPNRKTRFRLINAGSHAMFYFSVDEHTLDVVEADGTALVGNTTVHRARFHNGQRLSVIIDTTVGTVGDSYWIRAEMDTNCFAWIDSTLNSTAFAILRYGNTTTSDPTSSDWTDALGDECTDLDDSDLVPRVMEDAPSTVGKRVAFDSALGTITYAGVSYDRFFMNDTTYIDYVYKPILATVANNGTINSTAVTYAEFSDDILTGDIIINNRDANLDHPYHMHGFDFFIVARGNGTLNLTEAESLTYNTTNPMRRDTVVIPRDSYAVLRISNTLAGVWAIHCHIAWHLAEGFMGVLVTRPNAIAQLTFPKSVTDLCAERPAGVSVNTTEPGRKRSTLGGIGRIAQRATHADDFY